MYVYTGTSDNRLIVTKVSNEGGQHERIQTTEPLIETIPQKVVLEGGSGVVSFILKHPQYPLLYVFSSFGSLHPSMVSTFQVTDGTLQKLGRCVETGGLNVSFATISPVNHETLCVAHVNDGNLSFFDISNPQQPLEEGSLQIFPTPELRPETRTTGEPHCLPSLSHVGYHVVKDNLMILMACDTSAQCRVWTYAVDERGMPIVTKSKMTIIQQFKCHIYGSPLASFRFQQALLMPPTPKIKYHIRRMLIHPNQQYAYVLLDSHAVIHVYEVFHGKTLGGDCLQELPLQMVPPATKNSIHAGAIEMKLNGDNELVVANRYTRIAAWGRREPESWIQRYELQNGGARLTPIGNSTIVSGWVVDFAMVGNTKVVAGVANKSTSTSSIELFQQQQDNNFAKADSHVDLEGTAMTSFLVIPEEDEVA